LGRISEGVLGGRTHDSGRYIAPTIINDIVAQEREDGCLITLAVSQAFEDQETQASMCN